MKYFRGQFEGQGDFITERLLTMVTDYVDIVPGK